MRRIAALGLVVASLLLVDLSCNGGVNPGQIHEHQHEGPLPVHCSKQVGPTCIGATPGGEAIAGQVPPDATLVGVPGSRRSGRSVRLTVYVRAGHLSGSVVPRSPESASAAPAMKTGIGARPQRHHPLPERPDLAPSLAGHGHSSCEGVNILIEPSMVRVGFPHHPGSQVEGKVRIVAGACPPTSGTVTAWLQRYSFPPLGSPPGTPGSWHTAAGPRSVSVAGIEAPRTIRFLDAVCRPHHWWRLRIHGEDITDQGVPTSFTRCWPGGGLQWRCFRGRQGRFYLSCG